MRFSASIGCAVALAVLLLTGCSGAASRPSTSSAPVEKRRLPPGSSVTLKNGLTLTVPAGWAATLTVGIVPNDPLAADEYLFLDNWRASSGPKSFMVFSSSAASLPIGALSTFGRDSFTTFGEASGTTLFLGRAGSVYAPKRLMAAQTHVPGAALGVIFFAGNPEDPWSVLRSEIDVFRIRGLGLP